MPLERAAGLATLATAGDGRSYVVVEGPDGAEGDILGLDGARKARLARDPGGFRLITGAGRSGVAVDLRPGHVAFGPSGRLAADGSVDPHARRVPDGTAVPIEEVTR
jgi:hypothetical protein